MTKQKAWPKNLRLLQSRRGSNKLIYKVITQEELSKREAIDLLILPDMNIDLPINTLMKVICFLMGHANMSDEEFKNDIIICEIEVLKRFFAKDEVSEMVNMLRDDMENPKVVEIVSKYGRGFEEYYFDGKADGIEQRNSEIASILLVKGVDESIISESTSLSIDQIKQLKRKL